MTHRHAIANVASLLGEPTRAAILLALLDGRTLPAGELARAAGLSAAATSLHLSKLTSGGLLTVRSEGRHRYYRLASVEVAHALEALGVIATTPPSGPSLSTRSAPLRTARTCYDHLAGALGVAITQALEGEGILRVRDERTYEVTSAGSGWLAKSMQIDLETIRPGRRVLARRCLDWTERRPHLAGALGALLLDRLLQKRWLRRASDSRAITISARGELELSSLFSRQPGVRAVFRSR